MSINILPQQFKENFKRNPVDEVAKYYRDLEARLARIADVMHTHRDVIPSRTMRSKIQGAKP